ncbi:MAG TPA: isochorismate synthase [Longimicrobiales bacterium]|nr:isochorismate synthase [Longimicrobiales bacterium]
MKRAATNSGSAGATSPDTAADVLAFVREALARPLDDREIRLITVPAPLLDPEHILRLDPEEPGVYWGGSGDGTVMAGSGSVRTVAARGPDRFDGIRSAARAIWPHLRHLTHPDLDPATVPVPRLFGGFAFQEGRAAGPWEPFGDSRFLLPRLLYVRHRSAGHNGNHGGPPRDQAMLTLAVAAEAPGGVMVEAELQRLAAALSPRQSVVDAGSAPVPAARLPEGATTETAWADAVDSIHQQIRNGAVEKVVAARRSVLRLQRPADAAAVLRRLARDNAGEVRFALRHGGATFLGAAPERLIARAGDTVRTEAIAGSMGTGPGAGAGSDARERLLASAKDTAEHRYVVDAIATALAPLCDALDYPYHPDVRRLRHVVHLRTPFEGRLRQPVHVLDLVERLHPTPAVGGTPTTAALEWIARHEPVDRGWYAAPMGWFDADGNGDFVVALRSGLLSGNRAYLYAGAGIVRDSKAAPEFAETETKLRTMMDALGIAT